MTGYLAPGRALPSPGPQWRVSGLSCSSPDSCLSHPSHPNPLHVRVPLHAGCGCRGRFVVGVVWDTGYRPAYDHEGAPVTVLTDGRVLRSHYNDNGAVVTGSVVMARRVRLRLDRHAVVCPRRVRVGTGGRERADRRDLPQPGRRAVHRPVGGASAPGAAAAAGGARRRPHTGAAHPAYDAARGPSPTPSTPLAGNPARRAGRRCRRRRHHPPVSPRTVVLTVGGARVRGCRNWATIAAASLTHSRQNAPNGGFPPSCSYPNISGLL